MHSTITMAVEADSPPMKAIMARSGCPALHRQRQHEHVAIGRGRQQQQARNGDGDDEDVDGDEIGGNSQAARRISLPAGILHRRHMELARQQDDGEGGRAASW